MTVHNQLYVLWIVTRTIITTYSFHKQVLRFLKVNKIVSLWYMIQFRIDAWLKFWNHQFLKFIINLVAGTGIHIIIKTHVYITLYSWFWKKDNIGESRLLIVNEQLFTLYCQGPFVLAPLGREDYLPRCCKIEPFSSRRWINNMAPSMKPTTNATMGNPYDPGN